jgi:hypothetical protein
MFGSDVVPEWVWWAHTFVGFGAALAVTVWLDAPIWLAFVGGAVLTTALMLALRRPSTVWIAAVLGGLMIVATSAFVGALVFTALLVRVFGKFEASFAVSAAIGALGGVAIAVSSYRPLIARVRSLSPSR